MFQACVKIARGAAKVDMELSDLESRLAEVCCRPFISKTLKIVNNALQSGFDHAIVSFSNPLILFECVTHGMSTDSLLRYATTGASSWMAIESLQST